MFDSGNLLPSHRGDYIYFQHDGKPYVVQDPALLAQARTLLQPMEELRAQQHELRPASNASCASSSPRWSRSKVLDGGQDRR